MARPSISILKVQLKIQERTVKVYARAYKENVASIRLIGYAREKVRIRLYRQLRKQQLILADIELAISHLQKQKIK